jgi:HAD superfamily hydrolase (TIGR01493 family)
MCSGVPNKLLAVMLIKAVAFDFGHTLVDEQKDASVPLLSRPIHLMPDVSEVLPRIPIPMAVWANTRTATGADIRQYLERAGIGRFFVWVVTSVDAGFRKPASQFFDFALRRCELARDEVLFVGNQLNTDIAGAREYGIRTVWLCAGIYQSADETMSLANVRPNYMIDSLRRLPSLLANLRDAE